MRSQHLQPSTLPEQAPRPQELDSVAPTPMEPLEPSDLVTPRITLAATRIVRAESRLASLGLLSGAVETQDSTSLPILSLAWLRDLKNESAQSYGFSLTGGQIWGLHWENRSYCCLGDHSEPYWSLGVGSFYRSSEQLASLVNFERYHLRLGGGFEDLLGRQRRLRAEALLRLSPLGLSAELNLGWTWEAQDWGF